VNQSCYEEANVVVCCGGGGVLGNNRKKALDQATIAFSCHASLEILFNWLFGIVLDWMCGFALEVFDRIF
jgi:hypothetical protein